LGEFTVADGKVEDKTEILVLYRTVAAIEGGLARTASEITNDYVENFLHKSVESGIMVVARDLKNGNLIGEIHGYHLTPKVFAHLLGELTIAVHPDWQGVGVGGALFTEFMRQVKENRPDVLRVELIARESNQKALEFYEKLGFKIEGRMVNRIRSVAGGFEADIPMAWLRESI
jgi:ribosomal protein S18 acetylase RimI-like enzyme